MRDGVLTLVAMSLVMYGTNGFNSIRELTNLCVCGGGGIVDLVCSVCSVCVGGSTVDQVCVVCVCVSCVGGYSERLCPIQPPTCTVLVVEE